MYSIIQKIYEKNNKILKEGVKKVLNGDDVNEFLNFKIILPWKKAT